MKRALAYSIGIASAVTISLYVALGLFGNQVELMIYKSCLKEHSASKSTCSTSDIEQRLRARN